MDNTGSKLCNELFDAILKISEEVSEREDVANNKPAFVHACIIASSWYLSAKDSLRVHDLALMYMILGVSHANDSSQLFELLRKTRHDPFRIGELLTCALQMNLAKDRARDSLAVTSFSTIVNKASKLGPIADACDSSQVFHIESFNTHEDEMKEFLVGSLCKIHAPGLCDQGIEW
jgi:hypothetical protein